MYSENSPQNPDVEVQKVKETGLFTNYVFKAIPLAFDESMSYYETLCGLLSYLKDTVIPTLNNNADAILEIQNFCVEMKNYVDNYFDNLDVQEEINNKLDDMTKNGTLTNIIRTYIDPYIESQNNYLSTSINNQDNFLNNSIIAQNNHLDEMQTQIDAVTSGAPLVASSTAGMTDTTRVYVNTTDGKWYYYNGASWVAGGTYQATEDSSTLADLSAIISQNNLNVYDKSNLNHGYFNFQTNELVTETEYDYKYFELTVNPASVYFIKKLTFSLTGDGVAFFDASDELISAIKYGTLPHNPEYTYLIAEVPANAVKMIVNIKTAIANLTDTYMLINGQITDTQLKANDTLLRNQAKVLKRNYNNMTPYITAVSGLYVKYGYDEPQSSASSIYGELELDCISDKVYFCRNSQNYSISADCVQQLNSSKEVISNVRLTSLTQVTYNNQTYLEIPLVTNAKYMRFNLKISTNLNDTLTTKVVQSLTSSEIVADSNLELNKYKITQNLFSTRLYNKTWCCLGDSITAATFRSTLNYHDYIKDRCDMTVTNLGVSGIGLVKKVNNQNICDIIDGLLGSEDYDYITLFAGTNDIQQTLGDIDSTDTSTICGAFRYCIEQLIQKFPTKKIGILSPIPRYNYYGTDSTNKLYQIVVAELKIASEYSIPILNQYMASGLRPWNSNNNQMFFSCEQAPNGDGLHPNELGHLWLSYPIQDFIEKL